MQRLFIITTNSVLLILLIIGIPAGHGHEAGRLAGLVSSCDEAAAVFWIGNRRRREFDGGVVYYQWAKGKNPMFGMDGCFRRAAAGALGVHAGIFQLRMVKADAALVAETLLNSPGCRRSRVSIRFRLQDGDGIRRKSASEVSTQPIHIRGGGNNFSRILN